MASIIPPGYELEEEVITIPAGYELEPPDQSPEQLRQEEWAAMSGGEQMLIGAGEGLTRTMAGLADLLPEQLQPDELQRWKDDLALSSQVDSTYKTLGNVGTDLALLAAPGVGIAARASTLPRAIAAEAALTGAYEGAKLPEEGQSRLANAGTAAALTAATGAVLPSAISGTGKVARAIGDKIAPISPGARDLMDQGVRLTPGMARPGLAPVEKLMTRVPYIGDETLRMQRQALEDWNQQALNQVTPGGVSKAGSAGFKEAQGNFTKAYADAWKTARWNEPKLKAVSQQLDNYEAELDFVTPDFQPLARKTLAKVQSQVDGFKRTKDPRYLERADDTLRDAAYQVQGPDEAFFEGLRKRFTNAVPPDTQKAVHAIDRDYRDFMTLTRAGGYVDASQAGNVFTPRQVLGASKARSSPRKTSAGEGSMQGEAVQASNVMTPAMPRMNASELEESAAPLLTAAAAGVSPVDTAVGIGAARHLITPQMQGRLTGQIPYRASALTRATAASGMPAGVSSDEYQKRVNEILQMPLQDDELERQRRLVEELRGSYRR